MKFQNSKKKFQTARSNARRNHDYKRNATVGTDTIVIKRHTNDFRHRHGNHLEMFNDEAKYDYQYRYYHAHI